MRTGKKKLEPNQNDASDHFLSAKCLHTRPTFGSNDRFLLLNSMGFSQAKPNNKISGYLRGGASVHSSSAVALSGLEAQEAHERPPRLV